MDYKEYKLLTADKKIAHWENNFKETLNEIIKLNGINENSLEQTPIIISFLINKIATLTVASEDLGDRIRNLEKGNV